MPERVKGANERTGLAKGAKGTLHVHGRPLQRPGRTEGVTTGAIAQHARPEEKVETLRGKEERRTYNSSHGKHNRLEHGGFHEGILRPFGGRPDGHGQRTGGDRHGRSLLTCIRPNSLALEKENVDRRFDPGEIHMAVATVGCIRLRGLQVTLAQRPCGTEVLNGRWRADVRGMVKHYASEHSSFLWRRERPAVFRKLWLHHGCPQSLK